MEENVRNREVRQEKMKAVNAFYRKHQTLEGCGVLSADEIQTLKQDMQENSRTRPCPAFLLSENSAQIRRMKKRIEELKHTREVEFVGWEFQMGEAVVNLEYNRLQLFFSGKLSLEQKGLLRRAGFHWADSTGAWQRPLNWSAIRAAGSLSFIQPLCGKTPLELQPEKERKMHRDCRNR